MKKKLFLLILLLFFAVQPNIHGLDSESPQAKKDQKALQHEVAVTLKLVQVFVMDKKGNPITDLTKEDFILSDNGVLKTITDFEKHILTQPEKKIEKKADEKLEETELAPSQKVPLKMNRKFFLLLDLERNDGLGIINSKKAALHFMDTQIQPTDEVGILSNSPIGGLTVHEYLTTNHEKAKEAIKRIKGFPGGMEETNGLTRAEKEMMKQIIHRFIDEIREFAKSLRYTPGYKNIILFSGGIKRNLLYGDDPSLRLNLEDTIKELATSNSPVYTVNSKGTRAYLKNRWQRGGDSLKMISDLSGGKYFSNVAYYEKNSREIQKTTSNYYVLGYYIDEKWDGKYHEINVKVKQKGCVVHSQGGYFNPRPFTKSTKFEKKLHLINLALADTPQFQTRLDLPLITLPCSEEKESNFVLLSEARLDEIEDIGGEKTEVVALVFDQENNIVVSSRYEVDFSEFSQEQICPYAILSLSPGLYKCRIILRNLETGKGAVASSSINIPEPQDSGRRLFSPLLLSPKKNVYYINASKAQKKEAGKEPLSLINIYPFLSREYSPLVGNLDKETSKLLAVLRSSNINIQKSDVDLSVFLRESSSEKKTPLTYSILKGKKEGEKIDILLIELELPELQAGEYSIEIVAEEISTQFKSQVTRTFKVRQP
ncbi:MAG: VWA domain-containing protein [Candidatus Aminicenantaceae bacterium]